MIPLKVLQRTLSADSGADLSDPPDWRPAVRNAGVRHVRACPWQALNAASPLSLVARRGRNSWFSMVPLFLLTSDSTRTSSLLDRAFPYQGLQKSEHWWTQAQVKVASTASWPRS